jgi:NADH:ubiquinone oxidoreductase subunit 2 (subunit N)
VVAVINTMVRLYCYLRVIAPTVLRPAPADVPASKPPGPTLAAGIAIATVATVRIGPSPSRCCRSPTGRGVTC